MVQPFSCDVTMTDYDTQAIADVAQSMIDDASHYVEAVTAMAGSHDLIATQDIISSSGIKLIASGTRISGHLREKLRGHHLSGAMLERNLSVYGGVTPESLAQDMAQLMDSEPWLKQLATKSGDSVAMRHGAAYLDLPSEILFRLTVARTQRPSLYRHSLCVTLVSHYLAIRLALKQIAINHLLIAALCHDLGELYTPPAILDPGHQVSEDERPYIYVHPITGWLITRELSGIDNEVRRAILQHQERLDGSGYPNGLKDEAIGVAGRILAVADVADAIMARACDPLRLSTLLRLNSRKYDRKLLGFLHDAIAPGTPITEQTGREELKERLTRFAALLDSWSAQRDLIALSPATAFLSERMGNLRMVVYEFGFDPDHLEIPVQLAEEDAAIAAELTNVISELQFQLAEIGHEIDRRTLIKKSTLHPQTAASLAQWRLQIEYCIQ